MPSRSGRPALHPRRVPALIACKTPNARQGYLREGKSDQEPRRLRLSEKLAEIVAVNSGVAQDPGERAALEFTMKRDHQRNRALVVFETHMATALANDNPSDLLESVNQLLPG
jgi:hypothetical protein